MKGCLHTVTLALLLCLFACDSEPKREYLKIEGREAPIKALLMVKSSTSPFFISMVQGAQKAADDAGIELYVEHGPADYEASAKEQRETLLKWLKRDIDILVISPSYSASLIAEVKLAVDQGISVVNVDTQFEPKLVRRAGLEFIPHVASKNEQGGYLAAKYIAQRVPKPAQAIIIAGADFALNSHLRAKGARRAFAEFPDIEIVAEKSADWKFDDAYTAMKKLIKKHPEVRVIFCANDSMAMGVARYAEQNQLGDLYISGFDKRPEILELIKTGQVQVTIDQKAEMQGYIGIKTAVWQLQGKPVAEQQLLDIEMFTADEL